MRNLTIASMVLFAAAACASPSTSTTSPRSPHMEPMRATEEQNAESVRRVYEEGLNEGRMEVLEEVVDPSFSAPGIGAGPDAFRVRLEGLRRAFPDIHYTLEDVLADGDRVAIRWVWTGTHRGPFRSIEPTGKRISNTGFAVFQLRDGKIVRSWLETDRLGFLDAIGLLPPEIGALVQPGPPPQPGQAQQ